MNVVVLSGKGGTGKTTVSVNLAYIAGEEVALLDCDVEEPNSNLFVNKDFTNKKSVKVLYPVISEKDCIHCGKCGSFCNFNAILCTKKLNIIMKELCHDCGGCKIVCPVDAITFKQRSIGQVRRSTFINEQPFIDGILNTGEFSCTPIIKKILAQATDSKHKVIDAPPGTACAAVETVEEADLALIVTEPTPFALSDMKMVVEMLEKMKIPIAIFLNKSGMHDEEIEDFCKLKDITIIGKLPFTEEYGKAYAKGTILADKFPEVKRVFKKLWRDIINEY